MFALASLALYLRQRNLHPAHSAPRDAAAKRSTPDFFVDPAGTARAASAQEQADPTSEVESMVPAAEKLNDDGSDTPVGSHLSTNSDERKKT